LMARGAYQLKFVISERGDLAELQELVQTLNVPAANVILMPEGTSAEVVRQRGLWLAEICKEQGYRFSPRLHVDLYGNLRGV
jgi:7-carboxy-7-deazaguanine synthase